MEHVQHGYAYPNDDIMKSDAGIFSTSWRFCDHDTALEIGMNESLTVLMLQRIIFWHFVKVTGQRRFCSCWKGWT